MATGRTIVRTRVRPVLVPLRRPIVASIGKFREWPLILTDIELDDGLVGISYVSPYRAAAFRSIIAEIQDVAHRISAAPYPSETFRDALKTLNVVGYSGIR